MHIQFYKVVKGIHNIAVVLLAFSIGSITVGQFIPLYFNNPNIRLPYYAVLFILLVITTMITVFRFSFDKKKRNIFYSLLATLFFGLLTFVFFGIWTIVLLFTCWTELGTYYIKKDSPEIKIITRYKNGGAYDSGPLPGDIQVVVQRPVLYFLKMETAVDTGSLNKSEWIKQ